MQYIKLILFFGALTLFGCSSNDNGTTNINTPNQPKTYKILSLGDSYTIGQSVCETCRFPEQLKDSLKTRYSSEDTFQLKVIAQTGWTTTNLKTAITEENLTNDYDLVTLLIGVNNQFQGKPFSLYETEFPQLIQTSITAGKGDKNNLVVISIPDYAFTPFGQNNGNPEVISMEIDAYNTFAEAYCIANDITFINITDITREGLNNTDLVASDNLHPSELAYSRFVERLLPIALEKIE
jgi:lysophospholipase L1-like esterase